MGKTRLNSAPCLALAVFLGAGAPATGQYGAAIVSYHPGLTPAPGYTTPAAALGEPARFIGGGFPSVVSPFSPPYLAEQIVSVGEGGQITLRLSHYAIPRPGPELGVFENVGIIDIDLPNGRAGSPASTFGAIDSAVVEVSSDGNSWVGLGSTLFDVPTNGYSDVADPFSPVAGSVPSDFQQPFTGSLSSFAGLPYFDAAGPDMLEVLAGSGGGTWIDISASGLARVGYIRFSVPDDMLQSTALNFELDAVSIAHGAVGGTVPEPGTIASLVIAMAAVHLRRGSAWTPAVTRPGRAKLKS
jgi:hypothetical protein